MRYIIILTLILLTGCNPTTTDLALKALSAFTSGITLFEKAAKYFGDEVDDATSSASNEFSKHGQKRWLRAPYQVDMSAVAKRWESDWVDVSAKLVELDHALKGLESLGYEYFNELENISQGIQNIELRKIELKKNKDTKDEWDRIYTEAVMRVNRAKRLVEEGNDFHRVLVASAMRSQLGEHIETLKMISNEADLLVSQIQSLSEEARRLSSNPTIN